MNDPNVLLVKTNLKQLRLPTMRRRVARCRIDRRDARRYDRSGCAEGRIVENGKILVDRAARYIKRQSFVAASEALTIGLGADEARIDGKAVAPDQSFGHAALHCRLEQLTQQIAVTETPMSVLRERRMVRHFTIQPEAAEPSIREIEVYLLAQAPFRSDPDTVADDEHPDHQLGIDRRSSRLTVEWRKLPA